MTITVFGATGKVGTRIVRMALERGHHVRAFGRNIEAYIDQANNNTALEAIKGYVFDEAGVFDAVNGADAVLSSLGGAFDGSDETRSLGIKNIIEQMKKAGITRIITVAGMGILKHDEYEYIQLNPSFPPVFLPVSRQHMEAYKYLKQSGLLWTVVCPPDIIDENADGNYITRDEYLPETGVNKVFAGNIADCMLKELEQNNFVQQRVGICNT